MLRTQCAWPFLSRARELRCEIRTGREREREELRMLVGGGEIDTYGHAIHAAAIKSF